MNGNDTTLRISASAMLSGLIGLLMVLLGFIYFSERGRIDRLETEAIKTTAEVANIKLSVALIQADMSTLRSQMTSQSAAVERVDTRLISIQNTINKLVPAEGGNR